MIKYYEAYVGADLFGTPQAPTKTEIIRDDGRRFPTFFHVSGPYRGGKIPVPVQIVREVPEPEGAS